MVNWAKFFENDAFIDGIDEVWGSMDGDIVKAMIYSMQGRVKMMLELKGAAIIGSGKFTCKCSCSKKYPKKEEILS